MPLNTAVRKTQFLRAIPTHGALFRDMWVVTHGVELISKENAPRLVCGGQALKKLMLAAA
jgi:hypothetical protein